MSKESQFCPSVSIILPVYNQGETLVRAIESVVVQSFFDWELVIVNDGSADASAAIAQKYTTQDSRIIFLDSKHLGLSSAINAGFVVSKGSYITTLDADDFYKPNHLEDNFNFLKNNPEIDLLMSKTEIIGSPYVVDLERFGQLIHLDDCAVGGTFFVKRKVFESVGGRPPVQYGTDYYFAQAVINAGFKVHKRDTRTYVYDRTGDNSMTKMEENKSFNSRN